MKVSIIGGGGRVGSNASFALQCAGIVSEIHILDANEQMAAGEALDLIHGTSVAGDQKIYAGNYEKCADSDMVVITAGLRRKPDESRLDLINRNVALFKQILDSLKGAGLKKDAIIFVVSNPVDVLTRLAIDYLKWDPARTIVCGASAGGLAAAYVAWKRPDVFGNAGCLSSTFGYRDDLHERIEAEPKRPIKIYLDSGWPQDNYEVTRTMRNTLRSRGYEDGKDLFYLAFPRARHDEDSWAMRAHIPFQFFFGQ